MDELKDILREYVKRNQLLESSNELLREKLLEQEKLRKIYIDDLSNMKTCLGGLQDALMKCRANILSHEMLESSTFGGQGGHTKSAQVPNDNTMELVALQAQLEVCKNDLAEQRAAYQELLIEKNRITGEMQTLLQKNHQLSMNHAQNSRGTMATHQHKVRATQVDSMKLYGTSPGGFERQIEPCPHCNNVFGDFLTLETHIKDCPGLDY
ncbi:optineurin-like isoform X1 [Anopheles merus]|uniref:CCHC NOA-type domain-containing protein n=1 Tax=Anopheles merus TaxID=30066 RepID=A0A182V7D0_ANOME|nr:optineurin-like isoform X1 [Anopheles merus]XP_041787060.1 optineurin-like isoform X1 [Anopheles merus]